MKKLILVFLISFSFWPVVSQAQVGDLSAKLEQLRVQIQAMSGRSFTPVSTSALAPVPTASMVSINRDLSLGSEGEDVRSLQTFLQSKGYLKQAPTGYFGPATTEALRAWQLAEKIITIPGNGGIAGPLTRARLKGALGASSNSLGGGNPVSVGSGAFRFLVTGPLAGQSFTRGERMSVSWIMSRSLTTPITDASAGTSIFEASALAEVPKVDIILIKSGGQPHRLVSALDNRGFYTFIVPAALEAGNYLAKVAATNGQWSATSETFSLR